MLNDNKFKESIDNQLIIEKEDLANMSPARRARLERQKKQKETADKITEAKEKAGLDPMAPGTTNIEFKDGKPVNIVKDGVKVDPKISGDILNQQSAAAAGAAAGGTTNVGGSTTVAPTTINNTNVSGGPSGQGSVNANVHPQDPSSFRLESAQAQF